VSVIPSLPAAIEGPSRGRLQAALVLSNDAIEQFRKLDRDLWESSGHNPALMLGAIEQEKREEAAANDAFLDYRRRVSAKLVSYVGAARALGIPLVGVGLLYQQGVFSAVPESIRWQQEVYEATTFTSFH
jgi:starch phosphorylase